jgi:hypothetical protein
MKKLTGFFLLWTSLLSGQTQIDYGKQTRPLTRNVRSGDILPGTCSVGDIFVLTNAPAGQNLHACLISNTWTLQSGSGQISVSSNGSPVGSRPVQNLVAGAGIVQSVLDTGSQINIQTSYDTSVLQTRRNAQRGTDTLCLSQSASSTNFTCQFGLQLQSYTTGMQVNWIPDQSATGNGTTIAIDALPAVAVKMPNGTGNPGPADVMAGRMYTIWFDGAIFRLLRETDPVTNGIAQTRSNAQSGQALLCQTGGTATAFTCNLNPALTVYTTGMVLNLVPHLSATGAATTIAINGLAAVNLRLPDGTTNPTATDLIANRLHTVWFDGTAFRLSFSEGYVRTGTRPACSAAIASRIWFTAGATNVKDDVAVCAKDATNNYAWRTIY